MAIFTLEECKTLLNISDNPDILTTGTTTTGSDTITAIPSTSGLAAGNSITGAGIPASAYVTSVPAGGVTLIISASASVSATGVNLLFSDIGSSYDARITAFIPIIEQFINTYCRETFGSTSNPWPVDLKIPAAQMIWANVTAIQQAGVKTSESLGDYSVSYANNGTAIQAYNPSIMSVLNLYKKVLFI